MVVYVDVLVVLNTLITYFLILATKFIVKAESGRVRLILASLLGGVLSIYILLPQQHFLVEVAVKILSAFIITVIAFRSKGLKGVLRAALCFFLVTFAYSGFMIAFWYVLKPNGMVINNGVVYFPVSPLTIILAAAFSYAVIRLCFSLFKKENSLTSSVKVTLYNNSKAVVCNCMVDSGCTVSDGIGGRRVAIIEKSVGIELFGAERVDMALRLELSGDDNRFRIIPYRTLSSKGLMPAFLIDGTVCDAQRREKILVGIIDIAFDGDFCGIVSPEFLE